MNKSTNEEAWITCQLLVDLIGGSVAWSHVLGSLSQSSLIFLAPFATADVIKISCEDLFDLQFTHMTIVWYLLHRLVFGNQLFDLPGF